jgi:hypothetical protein
VGPALATALVASVADPKAFRSGRGFSAWVGLVPKQNSSGGKEKLGNITKQGDRYLRSLFCAGALAVIRYAKKRFWEAPPGARQLQTSSRPSSSVGLLADGLSTLVFYDVDRAGHVGMEAAEIFRCPGMLEYMPRRFFCSDRVSWLLRRSNRIRARR